MDLEQINNLTPEQKDRFLKLERTFASDGWPLIEEMLKGKVEQARQRLEFAKTWDEHRVFTGVRAAFGDMANLREDTEKEFENLADANKVARQELEEVEHE